MEIKQKIVALGKNHRRTPRPEVTFKKRSGGAVQLRRFFVTARRLPQQLLVTGDRLRRAARHRDAQRDVRQGAHRGVYPDVLPDARPDVHRARRRGRGSGLRLLQRSDARPSRGRSPS